MAIYKCEELAIMIGNINTVLKVYNMLNTFVVLKSTECSVTMVVVLESIKFNVCLQW